MKKLILILTLIGCFQVQAQDPASRNMTWHQMIGALNQAYQAAKDTLDANFDSYFVDYFDREGVDVSEYVAIKLENISAMLNADVASGNIVYLSGYYAVNDGGGGLFYWDASEDKANHNGGTVIDPSHTQTIGSVNWYSDENAGTGCWVRIHKSEMSVKEWGARGNNVNEDTWAFQNAFAIADINLFIPIGKYIVNTVISSVFAGKTITGQSRDSVIINTDGNHFISATGKSITIKNITIIGATDGSFDQFGIHFSNADKCVVDNVVIDGFSYAVYFGNTATDCTLKNSYIKNALWDGTGTRGYGFVSNLGAQNIVIDNNYFENCHRRPVYFSSTTPNPAKNAVISNNIMISDPSKFNSIKLLGGGRIFGNYIYQKNGENVISLIDTWQHDEPVFIYDNTIIADYETAGTPVMYNYFNTFRQRDTYVYNNYLSGNTIADHYRINRMFSTAWGVAGEKYKIVFKNNILHSHNVNAGEPVCTYFAAFIANDGEYEFIIHDNYFMAGSIRSMFRNAEASAGNSPRISFQNNLLDSIQYGVYLDAKATPWASEKLYMGNTNTVMNPNPGVTNDVVSTKQGTATIDDKASDVTVQLNYSATTGIMAITAKNITVTPLSNLDGRNFWISDVGNTSFKINLSAAADADFDFAWTVRFLDNE